MNDKKIESISDYSKEEIAYALKCCVLDNCKDCPLNRKFGGNRCKKLVMQQAAYYLEN